MELKGAGVAMQFNHYQSQGVCVCTLAINSWSRLVFFSLYHACQNKYNTSAHTQAFHSFFLLGQHPSVYSTKFPSSRSASFLVQCRHLYQRSICYTSYAYNNSISFNRCRCVVLIFSAWPFSYRFHPGKDAAEP
jgi:hypothetical protein